MVIFHSKFDFLKCKCYNNSIPFTIEIGDERTSKFTHCSSLTNDANVYPMCTVRWAHSIYVSICLFSLWSKLKSHTNSPIWILIDVRQIMLTMRLWAMQIVKNESFGPTKSLRSGKPFSSYFKLDFLCLKYRHCEK